MKIIWMYVGINLTVLFLAMIFKSKAKRDSAIDDLNRIFEEYSLTTPKALIALLFVLSCCLFVVPAFISKRILKDKP